MENNNQSKNKNPKQKKPLRLSSAGRLQLRKNLGPDQVKHSSSGKRSKTIQIVFKKKTSIKKDATFSSRHSFKKHTGPKPLTNKTSGYKFSPNSVLTKNDIKRTTFVVKQARR